MAKKLENLKNKWFVHLYYNQYRLVKYSDLTKDMFVNGIVAGPFDTMKEAESFVSSKLYLDSVILDEV